MRTVSSVEGSNVIIHEAKVLDFRHFRGVHKIVNIADYYTWTRLLGSGSFGSVHEAISVKSNVSCAVKIM